MATMLRISKLTDYATVILGHMARGPGDALFSAAGLSQCTTLGAATVSKLLKSLNRAGLVNSFRGSAGGYRLARPADQITAAQIIDALEGPVSITQCSAGDGHCDLECVCGVGGSWQRINAAIRQGLEHITLAQLLEPELAVDTMDFTTAVQAPAHRSQNSRTN